jgi:hypothetical protein
MNYRPEGGWGPTAVLSGSARPIARACGAFGEETTGVILPGENSTLGAGGWIGRRN